MLDEFELVGGGGGWGSGKEEWRVDVYPSVGTASNHWLLSWIAYVASVSVQFRSKERGTRVKDRAKNGVSKTAGRGWGRKEGNAGIQTSRFWKPPTWVCHAWVCSPTFGTLISCDNWPTEIVWPFFPSFPSPSPLFHFFALVSFLARPKPRIPFVCLSVLRNQTETLATQARLWSICLVNATQKSLS